ncbi:hypothetical protein BDV93DRAFT_255649 [Ceratobasidium sp. AG-I]|nr:hypothetical protein BDV93DRAFT_255649 [Ceratobasidium sp. AG-I]
MLPPQYPGYYEPRNHPAYIRSLEAPTPALADILPNQSHNAVHIKEEAVELALYEISSESSVPPQAQEVLPFATPTTQLPTSAAADPVLPIVKQEADIEEFRAHKRWVDCKNWLSELWKNLPAVPSTRSRCAWAKARGFLPATVHKWFGSKKHAYKRKHLAVHPQDGYELPVDEPRESLLVSLTPPGIQPSSLGHTPAFGASSSPFPQTPDDFESLDTQINALEPSSSNVKSKSTKRKAQAPVIPPLFSLAPGAQSGYISVPAQANTGACMRVSDAHFA